MTKPWSKTFTIYGRPTSWKNSRRGFVRPPGRDKKTGKLKPSTPCPHCKRGVVADIAKSPQAVSWYKEALRQLETQWTHVPIPKTYALQLQLKVYFPTRRFADCTSSIDAVQDALEGAEIIEDDVCIEPVGCERFVDRKRPRIVATITLKGDKP